MVSIETRKAQLQARRQELEEKLAEIEDALDEPVNKDPEDRASEREDDEVLERLGVTGLQEIEAINAALKRVEDGSYGECVTCGEKISDARLDLLPYTPKCRKCAV